MAKYSGTNKYSVVVSRYIIHLILQEEVILVVRSSLKMLVLTERLQCGNIFIDRTVGLAQCQVQGCQKIMYCKNGMSPMNIHLRRKHQIDLSHLIIPKGVK